MRHNPVVWFEIYVQDMVRARRFYEAVLGTTLRSLGGPGMEMWAFPGTPEAGGASGALVHIQGVHAGGNGTLVYFGCEDCAVEEARVVAAGGEVHKTKFAIGPYGFITLAVDPEGNMFGLHSMK